MTYQLEDPSRRTTGLKSASVLGVKLIVGVFGFTYFTDQVKKISTLSPSLANYFYIALLAIVCIKAALWIAVAQKEIDILSTWLDPRKYYPPDETVNAVLFALVLCGLILSSRNLIVFGAIYVVYAVVHMYGWMHLRRELRKVIKKSRLLLQKDPPSHSVKRLCTIAIDLIETYYLGRLHLFRAALVLFLSTAGLIASIKAHLSNAHYQTYAYGLYVFSLVVPEEVVTNCARAPLYSGIRRLEGMLYDLRRHEAGTAPQSNSI